MLYLVCFIHKPNSTHTSLLCTSLVAWQHRGDDEHCVSNLDELTLYQRFITKAANAFCLFIYFMNDKRGGFFFYVYIFLFYLK